jgi:hypothetical protein
MMLAVSRRLKLSARPGSQCGKKANKNTHKHEKGIRAMKSEHKALTVELDSCWQEVLGHLEVEINRRVDDDFSHFLHLRTEAD